MVGNKISMSENLEILSTIAKFKEISYSSEVEEKSLTLKDVAIKEKGRNIIIQDEKGERIEFTLEDLKEIIILEDKKIVDCRCFKDDSIISVVFFFKEGEFEIYLERVKKAESLKGEEE